MTACPACGSRVTDDDRCVSCEYVGPVIAPPPARVANLCCGHAACQREAVQVSGLAAARAVWEAHVDHHEFTRRDCVCPGCKMAEALGFRPAREDRP